MSDAHTKPLLEASGADIDREVRIDSPLVHVTGRLTYLQIGRRLIPAPTMADPDADQPGPLEVVLRVDSHHLQFDSGEYAAATITVSRP